MKGLATRPIWVSRSAVEFDLEDAKEIESNSNQVQNGSTASKVLSQSTGIPIIHGNEAERWVSIDKVDERLAQLKKKKELLKGRLIMSLNSAT